MTKSIPEVKPPRSDKERAEKPAREAAEAERAALRERVRVLENCLGRIYAINDPDSKTGKLAFALLAPEPAPEKAPSGDKLVRYKRRYKLAMLTK